MEAYNPHSLVIPNETTLLTCSRFRMKAPSVIIYIDLKFTRKWQHPTSKVEFTLLLCLRLSKKVSGPLYCFTNGITNSDIERDMVLL